MTEKASWKMIGTTGVCVTSDGYIVRRSNEDEGKIVVTDRCGNPVDTFPSPCACKAKFCNSFNLCEFETPISKRYLLAHNCFGCGRLVIIDRMQHSVLQAFAVESGIYDAMCAGPMGTIFLASSTSDVLVQLQIDESTNTFSEIKRLQIPCGDVLYMIYRPQDELLVLSSWISGQITAVTIDDKIISITWQLTGPVQGKRFGARGICGDDDGRI